MDFVYTCVGIGALAFLAWRLGSSALGAPPEMALKEVWDLISKERLKGEFLDDESEDGLAFQRYRIRSDSLTIHYRKARPNLRVVEKASVILHGRQDSLVIEWFDGVPVAKRYSQDRFTLTELSPEEVEHAELILQLLRSSVST